MTDALLRSLHVQWWVPFVIWFGWYILMVFWYIINGYGQEYMGWRHAGRPGKIHKVLIRFHTGAHVQPEKSYGDEKRLKRVSGSTNRATPEGAMVYWTPRTRKFRAVRNNLIVIVILTVLSTMVVDPVNTVRAVTLLFLAAGTAWLIVTVRKLRRKHANAKPVSPKPVAQTRRAKALMEDDESTIGRTPKLEVEDKPQLEGVPATVLATLLAGKMGCSTAEIINRLELNADRGQLILPDTYSALLRLRDEVQEIIEAHTVGKVKFTWKTTETPRTLTWLPVVEHTLPDYVRFRDYLPQIERLGAREFGIGVVADKAMFSYDHNGDNPWWCRFAGSGTGKSMGFLVKAAQLCRKDPQAELYCIDTKQISFNHLHGIPRVYIYDNPVTEMDKIWRVFYEINGIVTDRYTAVREGRARLEDYHDIWMLVDEGNHLGGKIKTYAQDSLGESGTPRIWWEAIAPILQQGRQVRVFGEWMFQDLTDRAMGGQSLKFAFNTFGAAGFLPNQFTRTIGGKAEESLEGPGKILMCRGKRRTWVQGFADDEQWLHDYALEGRKEMAA
jgi:hypothetical protein